ncbi:hypothetical protein C8A01DRAFT_13181 [Parachaetomium inaequale]|uniref:Uncharacterized protein n=1 Tax=Parachaetomium inaequale TaxID=2588326 RepID=A0AAN6SV78_9PEZI|nr:hypothetical protein C8A01DRAFT_13181 [Parachaetomium inaequale]
MPSATTPRQIAALPPLQARDQIRARLTSLTDAIAAHPGMRPPTRHPTLYHIWDFAMRTNYILSELDNMAAGRALQYPEQIPDYSASGKGTPDPAQAWEHFSDAGCRCTLIELMLCHPNRAMMAAMGLQDMDFGEELKGKAREVVEAVKGLERSVLGT